MQINLPVSQTEYIVPASELLVSTTDTQGRITHCNEAFAAVSGYAREELMGQPHNLIRHPDMPRDAFKDMWRTIGRGQPWTGVVKNRRKNGDYYWVRANVTPIMQDGRPKGYMSVRVQPLRAEVAQAQQIYAQLRGTGGSGQSPWILHAGLARRRGPRGWWQQALGLPLTVRLTLLCAVVAALAMVPDAAGWQGMQATAARALVLGLGLGAALAWFHQALGTGLRDAVRFAGELSACDLSGSVRADYPEPLGGLVRRLCQIQVNLRAVVGDVRREINGFSTASSEIAQASLDLSERTESQASSLEETAASMEQLGSMVQHSADTAAEVCRHGDASTEVALRGEHAVEEARQAMAAIAQSSQKIGEISGLIEGIAFQTSILSLNAAVEAARAGEQGRGFAVVAGEVRALAQRSSTAAKEIRQLIEEARQRTDLGAQRITGAGGILQEVRQSVSQVGAMVRQIASSTQEQSAGIGQVNEAVAGLDSVTQQNAAMAEQSAAAASSLRHSAALLRDAVLVFHMPDGAADAAPAPGPVALGTATARFLSPPAAAVPPPRRPGDPGRLVQLRPA